MAKSLVAHVDLSMLVLDLIEQLGSRVIVFHIHSHINLAGNDKADALANQGRLSSGHYSRGLDIDRTPKRPRVEPPDVAEVNFMPSSDDELEARYSKAARLSQGLQIPPQPRTPRRGKASAPPPPPSKEHRF